MKTTVAWKKPNGETVIAQCTWATAHGKLAMNILGSVLAMDSLKDIMQEEPNLFNAKRTAILACDLAEAMYAELEIRDWLLHLPDPNNAPEESLHKDDGTNG